MVPRCCSSVPIQRMLGNPDSLMNACIREHEDRCKIGTLRVPRRPQCVLREVLGRRRGVGGPPSFLPSEISSVPGVTGAIAMPEYTHGGRPCDRNHRRPTRVDKRGPLKRFGGPKGCPRRRGAATTGCVAAPSVPAPFPQVQFEELASRHRDPVCPPRIFWPVWFSIPEPPCGKRNGAAVRA